MKPNPTKTLLICSLILTVFMLPASGQDHQSALKDYLTDDVVAVVYFNLEKIEPVALLTAARQLGYLNDDEVSDYSPLAEKTATDLAELRQAGVEMIYGLLRTTDIEARGTSWVIPIANGKSVSATAALQKFLTAQSQWNLDLLTPQIEAADNAVIGANSEAQLKRLRSVRPAQARDLTDAFDSVGGGSMGLVLFGDTDSRRVLRELFSNPTAPFDMITGPLLADELKWAGIELTLPPKLNLKMELEASHPESAAKFQSAIQQGIKLLMALPQVQSVLPKDQLTAVELALQPSVTNSRLSVFTESVTSDSQRLAQLLSPQIKGIREEARMMEQQNNLRTLALGMLNYESAFSHLPIPNGKSETHPAGLSWRVHILPFMNQNDLYHQFKLDEPWDSAHNLPLVKKMPPMFWSSGPEHLRLNREGKTVYQLPISDEGIFQPDASEGAKYGDMKDGSSNTILMVTVAPEQAVPWTKPADWEVDLDQPLIGLTSPNRAKIAIATADGSNVFLPITIKPETFRALLTADGGEVIDSGGF